MRLSRATVALVVASLSLPMIAHAAQAVGKLTSASEGTFVSHDGKLVPAFANQALFVGDRVITRNAGYAQVALQGCSYALTPTSMLSVDAAPCGAAPMSLAAAGTAEEGGGGGDPTDNKRIFLIGGALAAAGITAAVISSQDDDNPTSP